MTWSWRLGTVAGIEIRIHALFPLLLVWVGWAYYAEAGDAGAALVGVAFVLLLFCIVVLHELGHALTARRYGVATRDITLLPIGGVARMERMPEEPRHELAVALAGPAVNVVLALVLSVVALALGGFTDVLELTSLRGVVTQLVAINVALALFNLLPAFPMDGGRALRALLAMRMDGARATQVAASLGQVLAVGLGLVGLLASPVLVFIAVFVWLGAGAEAKMAAVKKALDGIPVAYATAANVATVAPSDPLELAVKRSLAGFQHDFPVVANGEVVGVLSRADLLRAVSEGLASAPVERAMQSDFVTAHPYDMLELVLERLQRSPSRCLVVVRDDGALAGVLTLDSVGELIALRDALGHVAA